MPELEDIHLSVLALTALAIIYSDHEAFSYLRGKKPTLDPRTTRILHYLVWTGLVSMIVSGILLAGPAVSHFIADPAFLAKMLLVLALVINGFLIGRLAPLATTTPFAELPQNIQRRLMISGAVSTIGWLGAAFIGYSIL